MRLSGDVAYLARYSRRSRARSNRFAILGCCLTILLFGPTAARAQVSASISGTVTDPQAATVSGANVNAKNVETGETRRTVTDDAGSLRM